MLGSPRVDLLKCQCRAKYRTQSRITAKANLHHTTPVAAKCVFLITASLFHSLANSQDNEPKPDRLHSEQLAGTLRFHLVELLQTIAPASNLLVLADPKLGPNWCAQVGGRKIAC